LLKVWSKKNIKIDGTCESVLPQLGINCLKAPGNNMELVYQFPIDAPIDSESFAFVCTDMLFNHKKVGSFFVDNVLNSTGYFGVTPIGRMFLFFSRSKNEFAHWLENIAKSVNWEVIIVAHGDPIIHRCSFELTRVARELLEKYI